MRKIERLEAASRDSSTELLKKTVDGLIEIYERENPRKKVASFTLHEKIITIPENGVGYEVSTKELFLYEAK